MYNRIQTAAKDRIPHLNLAKEWSFVNNKKRRIKNSVGKSSLHFLRIKIYSAG